MQGVHFSAGIYQLATAPPGSYGVSLCIFVTSRPCATSGHQCQA